MSTPVALTPTSTHTPGISSKSSRSTLSRQDDLLKIPAATEAYRQREVPPSLVNDERLTAFPFPPQHSPQRSPSLGTIIDELVQFKEAQAANHRPLKPIIRQRFTRSISDYGRRQQSRRAATVLSLIDELAYHGETEEPEDEEEIDVQGVDEGPQRPKPSYPPEERYRAYHDDDQKAGVAAFRVFEVRMDALDRQLLAFHNAVRHLGSSVGIFVAAVALRDRFSELLISFRNHSSIAFPAIKQKDYDTPARFRTSSDAADTEKPQRSESPVPELGDLSRILELLARDLEGFLDRINQISEFVEEGVNTCVTAFVVDLRFWASSLDEFELKLHSKELSQYIHDLTDPLGQHALAFTTALASFVDVGVPTIRFAQQQAGKAFLNLSTVSTLLSGVTATTIQFTYADSRTLLQQSVNLLWIMSLVFSIASAINAQLAYYWSATKFRSPRSQVPWWGFMVITQAPLYFLIGSVVAFSAGLVCFTFSAFALTVIPIIITTCTAITLTSLVAVIVWLAGERWAFIHSRGTRWFITFVYPAANGFIHSTPHRIARTIRRWRSRIYRRVRRLRGRLPERTLSLQPITAADIEAMPRPIKTSNVSEMSQQSRPSQADTIASRPPVISPQPSGAFTRQRIPSISVRMASELESPFQTPRRKLPIMTATAALSHLAPVPPLHKHVSPILHIAFSPDGKLLASSGWDTNVLIWKVGGESMAVHRTLVHPSGPVRQVCWSPDGRMLIGRMRRTILLWEVNALDTQVRIIEREIEIRSMCWMPNNKSIITVEGSRVTIIDLNGAAISSHLFPRLDIRDVAVTKDGSRIVAVATLQLTNNGLSPSTLTPEKRLLVYNLDTRTTEDQMPTIHAAKHVTLNSNDNIVLVTYERKAPQLLRLVTTPGKTTRHLTSLHSCHYSGVIEAVGPSSIGALCANTEDDQLIVSAGKDEVRLWERETGRLFDTAPLPDDDDVELTCAAWNHGATDSLTLAAGANDGSLRVWKCPAP